MQGRDPPLAAVLTSPFGGLDARELAAVGSRIRTYPLPGSADVCGSTGCGVRTRTERSGWNRERPGQSAAEKLRQFYARAAYFRRKVPYTPIHELLEEVMEKTGYRLYITAMPGGAQRAANLDMLTERAAAFEEWL